VSLISAACSGQRNGAVSAGAHPDREGVRLEEAGVLLEALRQFGLERARAHGLDQELGARTLRLAGGGIGDLRCASVSGAEPLAQFPARVGAEPCCRRESLCSGSVARTSWAVCAVTARVKDSIVGDAA